MTRKPARRPPPIKDRPARPPIAREGGSWIVGKDGTLLREVPSKDNGGGRALTEAEAAALAQAAEKEA